MSLRVDVENLAGLWRRHADALRVEAEEANYREVAEFIAERAADYYKRAGALQHILDQNPEES